MPDPEDRNDPPVPGRDVTGMGPIAGETVTTPLGTPIDPLAPLATETTVPPIDERGGRDTVPPLDQPARRATVAPGDEMVSRNATSTERTVRAGGPGNWWRLGLLVLAIIVVVLGIMQLMSGGAGTETLPGSPVSAPAADAPVTTTPAADAPTPQQ